MIAGRIKPAAFDSQYRHGKLVACSFLAARRLIQLTVLCTKQMSVRTELFSAPTTKQDASSKPHAPRAFKKDTHL
jgi:hypothetical protein